MERVEIVSHNFSPKFRLVTQLVITLVLASISLYAKGTIKTTVIPDNTQIGIKKSEQDITVIDIKTPNSKGVSHNTFSRYEIGVDNAILNNGSQLSQSKLGGHVEGNPNLSAGAASTIIVESTSLSPVQLHGKMEVVGSNANVIIASSAGLICNQCGVLNSNDVTLLSGKVLFEGDSISGFSIEDGNITIGQNGFDSRAQAKTKLLARSIKIDGDIQANTLFVIAGRNKINHDMKGAQESNSSQKSRPLNAISLQSLGGIYANRIYMLSTEKGAGFNNSGVITAKLGGFELQANGIVENSGEINATKRLDIASKEEITNKGRLISSDMMDIDSERNLYNSGEMASAKGTWVTAKTDIVNDGLMISRATITAAAETVNNSNGYILASQTPSIQVKQLSDPKQQISGRKGQFTQQERRGETLLSGQIEKQTGDGFEMINSF